MCWCNPSIRTPNCGSPTCVPSAAAKIGWRGDFPSPKYPRPGGVNEQQAKMLQQARKAFTYHAPKDDQPARYVALRDAAYAYAELIVAYTPPSREQSLALTHLEEAVMWANASIARNE